MKREPGERLATGVRRLAHDLGAKQPPNYTDARDRIDLIKGCKVAGTLLMAPPPDAAED